jgi:threonine/homoserine/homoserine lactone efflux protein
MLRICGFVFLTMHLFRVLITGLFISFLGTLPLGTLNIAAMQISISDGVRPAIYFALGALLVEVIYVRISLVAMDWVRKRKKLFRWLEWITVLIIAALAVSSFIAAADPEEKKNVLLSYSFHRFWLGVVLSALNPVQIPFWFGWSTALFTKKILLPKNSHYNMYILGIGIGTLIGNMVFILGGRLIVDSLNNNQHIVQYVIGSIFAITAILMLWKMITKKDAISEMKEEGESAVPETFSQ